MLLDTTMPMQIGQTIIVPSGGNLQAAINQALPGDTIEIAAGATFTGNFILPNKSGAGWIVIQSSSALLLPSPGNRVSPALAGLMPKIVTANSEPAIRTAAGAHHYRLIGLEIGIAAGVSLNYGIVALGEGGAPQTTLASAPSNITVDRCYVHGNSTGDVIRGIALNSASTAVIDSFISECHAVGFDTQAICGWNGPGPYKIVNDYLEGAGENFMIGGADPTIPNLVASDIEFRRNHLYKPLRWKEGDPSYAGIRWSVKNIFELKSARRVWIEGNIFENNWQQAQDGFAIVLKVQNQDGGATWTETVDVTFINNIIRHSGAGINLLGLDPLQQSLPMKRLLIRNNLWEDINGSKWGGTHGRWLQIGNTDFVTVDRNTVQHTGNVITAYGVFTEGSPSVGFIFTNNSVNHNAYGVIGDGRGTGLPTINQYFPQCVFTGNLLNGGNASLYPAGNYFTTASAPPGIGADLSAITDAQNRP